MQAFRDRRFQLAGAAGAAAAVSLYLAAGQVEAISFAPQPRLVEGEIAAMAAGLPASQPDGTMLENVAFDGQRVVLSFSADDRLDLRMIRDAERDKRCETWSRAMRAGEATSVEYRYRVDASTSSVFLDRTVCG